MQEKIRYQLEIDNFKKTFSNKKHLNIALYGTGQKTATLVTGLTDFHIVGLLDRDEKLVGKKMYGVDVITQEEAETKADIIIINTTPGYWETIYQRIKDWKIPIYYLNGKPAALKETGFNGDNPYWKKSLKQLEHKIQEYEIISFDIFDTLVMRKVFLPMDVFLIVEDRIQRELNKEISYAEYRKKAAGLLNEPSIDEIYEKMKELTGWEDAALQLMKQCEIDTDFQLLVPRLDMVELCNRTISKKEVYFVSDMFYPKELIYKVLKVNGIHASENQIIVSNEYHKSKMDGSLWEYYNQHCVKNRNALHIGDNQYSDSAALSKYNIDTYLVWSASEMLKNSALYRIVPEVRTLPDSLFIGLLGAKLFNSPFALCSSCGKISFKDLETAGYCLLGGIVYSFLIWLIKNAKSDHVEQLLFFARDGYLMVEEYKYLQSKLEEETPEAVYLEISRRVIGNVAASCEEDLYKIAKEPYLGNLQEFLQDRFGVSVERNQLTDIMVADYQNAPDELKKMLNPYMDRILLTNQKERIGYLNYLSTLNLKERIGIVDTFRYGSIQYYLSNVLHKALEGYYFCIYCAPSNKYYESQNMKGCFQRKDDLTGEKTYLFQKSMFTEGFFTAPVGMLQYIDEDGEKIYSAKMSNQEHFDIRKKMQDGVMEYLKDIMEIQKGYSVDELYADEIFSDQLFGYLMDSDFLVPDEMKKGFFYDNGLLHRKEYPIWE